MNMKPYTKKIVLENGQEFYGYGFGADKEAICEHLENWFKLVSSMRINQ